MPPSPPGDGPDRSTAGAEYPGPEPRLWLEFHSDDLARPFRSRIDDDVTIEVASVVPLSDGTHLQYWKVANTSAERLLETVVDFPTTHEARLLSTVDGTHRIEVHGSSESLFAAFDDFGGVTRSAVYDENGVHVVAELPTSTDVDRVVEAVHGVYPDLDLVASHEVETVAAFRDLVETRLTERQLTALQLAYFGGYFEQPRGSTGEELAERMGISKQAFHEHLRKSHAVVFEQLFENNETITERTEVDW